MTQSSTVSRPTRLAVALLALLAVMSFVAASANAEGSWTFNGKKIEGSETVELRLTWVMSGTFLISTTVGLSTVIIHCTDGLAHRGILRVNGVATAQVLTRGNCVTLINGVAAAACKPKESIELLVKLTLFLHEKKSYIRFEPESGETLGTIILGEKECAIGEKLTLTGKFVTEGPTLETESVEQELIVNNKGLFADEVKASGKKATIAFDAKLGLEKPNEGLKWGGIG